MWSYGLSNWNLPSLRSESVIPNITWESPADIVSSLETSITQVTGPLSWSSNCWCCTQQPPWCFPPVRTTSRTWQKNKLFLSPYQGRWSALSIKLFSNDDNTTHPRVSDNWTQPSMNQCAWHAVPWPRASTKARRPGVKRAQHSLYTFKWFVCLVIGSLESKIKNLNPPNYLLAIELATCSTKIPKINSLKLFM